MSDNTQPGRWERGNRIIADFLGYEFDGRAYLIPFNPYQTWLARRAWKATPVELSFHLSWDWLMKAVIKIEENNVFAVRVVNKICTIERTYWPHHMVVNVVGMKWDSKLSIVFGAVVHFIENKDKEYENVLEYVPPDSPKEIRRLTLNRKEGKQGG